MHHCRWLSGIAVIRVTIAYFYSTGYNTYAYILVYGEPVMIVLLLLILPLFMDVNGVWAAIPLEQLIMAGLALALRAWRTAVRPPSQPLVKIGYAKSHRNFRTPVRFFFCIQHPDMV